MFSYSYDDAGRLLSIFHEVGAEVLPSFEYTYDPNGNRTQVQEYYQIPGAGPTVAVTVADERGDGMPGVPVYVFDGPPTPASTRPPTRTARFRSRCRRGTTASGRTWTGCSSGAGRRTTARSPAAPAS